jgi:hypothetical protein
MTTIVISPQSGTYPFGALTNTLVQRLIGANIAIERLHEAIATAASGYTGIEGTEFEVPTGGLMQPNAPQTLFGVMANDTPGDQGKAYRYAMDSLYDQFQTFWAAAQAYVQALDNGQGMI